MRLLVFFIFSLFLSIGSAAAFVVSPLRADITAFGADATKAINVANKRPETVFFEVSVKERVFANDGSFTLKSADDDFVVFPPLGQVPTGESRNIRIQYVGPSELTQTRAYSVTVAEVPAELGPGVSGVRVAFAYASAFYVRPPNATVELQIVATRAVGGDAAMRMANIGNHYARLRDYRLLDAQGDTIAEGVELEQIASQSIVFPGTSPVIRLEGVKASAIKNAIVERL